MKEDSIGCLGSSRLPGPLCGSRVSVSSHGAKTARMTLPITTPVALNGSVTFKVDAPPQPKGPAYAHLGVYELLPDAILNIRFDGTVRLPEGRWEVGIVQYLWNDRVSIIYSEGGDWFFSFDSHPVLLDNLRGAADIWLDSLGQGVQNFVVSGAPKTVRVSLESGDTPTSPTLPGRRKRCGDKIDELLVYAERTLLLFAVVACRKNGVGGPFFPILATGDVYGMYWKLRPAPGSPDFRFKPIQFRHSEQPPFQGPARYGTPTSGKTGNQISPSLVAAAESRYLADCQKRPPRQSPEEDYWFR
jgi:hypothetical protein